MTIHVNSLAGAAARGHTRAGARAVAVERRQPLHRALARAQQRARAATTARRLPASATTRSHRPRPAVQHARTRRRARASPSSSRATPNSTSAPASSSANRPNTSRRSLAATDHFFAELVRDQPMFTKFLVETAKAVTTIGARSATAHRPDRKRQHDVHARSATSRRTSPRASKSCRSRCSQGNKTFAELPVDVQRARKARRRLQADHAAADRRCSPACARCVTDGHAGRQRTSARRSASPAPNNDLTDFALRAAGARARR